MGRTPMWGGKELSREWEKRGEAWAEHMSAMACH